MSDDSQGSFEQAVADRREAGLLREFWEFLRHNKKWWLVPLILIIMLEAILLLLSSSAVAPFIYPLF
jgi:hypothetical protein